MTTRNKEIFEGEKNSLGKVAAAAKALWVEALFTRGMHSINKEALTVEERDWASELLVFSAHLQWTQPKKINYAILENKNESGRVQRMVGKIGL